MIGSLRNFGLALVLAIVGHGPVASAEPNVYDIEVVVFLNNTGASSSLERPDSERVTQLDRRMSSLFQKTGSIVSTPIEGGHLGQVANRLAANPNYVVLQHATWRQQVDVISQVPYVDISALGLGEESGLRGLVRFYHSPLLYVDVFLKYTPLDDALAGGVGYEQGGFTQQVEPLRRMYFLEEKRRVKLKETHYLDHPKLGVIISVWPIQENAQQSGEDSTPPS